MTLFGFIRHGVTEWNTEQRIQGHTDIPLNEEGRKQAKLLADRLEQQQWDFIYSSDLSRAHDTALEIASRLNLEVLTDASLREVNCGLTEGTTEEERIAKWGTDWRSLDLGRETFDEISTRATKLIAELAARHLGKRILIVSHGGLIGVALRSLLPNFEMKEHLLNTSLTLLKLEHSQWQCDKYNCCEHLVIAEN